MHNLPADWTALCIVIFLLGVRHGFDADHLAAVDGMTRLGARQGRTYSRYCGALFSMGHGVVVMAVAMLVGLISAHWTPPGWLDTVGAWISIGFLVLIGVVNMRAVMAAPPDSVVALTGTKSIVFGRLIQARSPLGVAAVGALFALSFDTLSQTALFAAAATRFGGVGYPLLLGALFVLGMVATDGLNGWWISRLIAKADGAAAVASRVMGVAVSAASLLVAAFGAARLLWPAFDAWSSARGMLFGSSVLALIALSYGFARWISRSPGLGKAA